MKGSRTRKPSSTSTASITSVMRRRSQAADANSSISTGGASQKARGVAGNQGKSEHAHDREAQVPAQAEVGGRQLRTEQAMLVEPEEAEAYHQQRKSPLATHDDRGRGEERRNGSGRRTRRRGGQPTGEREPPVHGSGATEQHRSPGDRAALGELAVGVAGEHRHATQTEEQR